MITGIMYGKSEGDNNDDYYEINQMYSITQVPIKFEYQFPYKIIKPKFDAGISFTFIYEDGGVRKNQGLSGSHEGSSYFVFNALGSAGVLICVSKNAGFDLSVDVEVISLTRSHSFYITHSFNGGVYFRF